VQHEPVLALGFARDLEYSERPDPAAHRADPGVRRHLLSARALGADGLCAGVRLARLTDWLDGWLARRWGQTSPLGAFLDPVADKLMVAIALVLLVQAEPQVLLALPAAVIIGREITVSALREWMAEIGARGKVAVSMAGKLKTTAQMIAIVLLISAAAPGGCPSPISVWCCCTSRHCSRSGRCCCTCAPPGRA
jgi:phosphatidylglycerophosphate synthase